MMTYSLVCERGHELELDPTGLDDRLLEADFTCPRCDQPLELAQEISLECYICDNLVSTSSLDEAAALLDELCGACAHREFTAHSFRVRESWRWYAACYEWMRSGRGEAPLMRVGRTDYWEGAIHFCEPQEFAAIYDDGRIKASPTGYFRESAVCLTEATRGNWEELQRVHGPFGYLFKKRQLIEAGGGPAVYLPEHVLKAQKGIGFSSEIKPFVNLLRLRSESPIPRPYDYFHEREWRVPHDVVLDKTEPFGVIVDWSRFTTATPGWQHAWGALLRYEELNADADAEPEPAETTA